MNKELVVIALLITAFFVQVMQVHAALDFDSEISAEDEASFDAILAPVMKVYQFIKYSATIIGVLMLVYAGISFAISGGDQAQKEKAKNTAVGVVIGLILIWVAPLIVEYIFS